MSENEASGAVSVIAEALSVELNVAFNERQLKRARAIIAALSAAGVVLLTPGEANLVRQWFNSVTDVTPEYLEEPDRVLGERITRIVAAATPPGEAGGRG